MRTGQAAAEAKLVPSKGDGNGSSRFSRIRLASPDFSVEKSL